MQLTRIFKYEGEDIRVVPINGEPWFVLNDVCEILGIGNSRMAADRLQDCDLTSVRLTSGGQQRELNAVNEPGLYEVIIRSDKPEAVAFRRWVTHEVLPSIAKRGKFVLPETKAFRKRGRNCLKEMEEWFERGEMPEIGQLAADLAAVFNFGNNRQ